jgi:molybdopterin-binding protein
MKISARNVFPARMIEVSKGARRAHVKIDVGGTGVTSASSNAWVDDPKLAPGKEAHALIKAADAMIGID